MPGRATSWGAASATSRASWTSRRAISTLSCRKRCASERRAGRVAASGVLTTAGTRKREARSLSRASDRPRGSSRSSSGAVTGMPCSWLPPASGRPGRCRARCAGRGWPRPAHSRPWACRWPGPTAPLAPARGCAWDTYPGSRSDVHGAGVRPEFRRWPRSGVAACDRPALASGYTSLGMQIREGPIA